MSGFGYALLGRQGQDHDRCGCLLIDAGLDFDAAIARIAELRAETRKAIDACPVSPSQHGLLRDHAVLRLNAQKN